MIADDLLPHRVDVEQPGTKKDRYGNDVTDWSASTHTAVDAWMQQNTGAEDTDGRDAQIGEWLMICNPFDVNGDPLTIRGEARVHWDGLDFEVVGPPGPAYEPTALHHFEIRLKTVQG